MKDWHMDKKIIIGLIISVLSSMTFSIFQFFYVLKTLDTDPPIINRIIALEYHMSEHGRLNQQILDELKEARKERMIFRKEQNIRTTTIRNASRHMRNRSLHK